MGRSFSRKYSAGKTIEGLLLAPFTVFATVDELVASEDEAALDEDVEAYEEDVVALFGETRDAAGVCPDMAEADDEAPGPSSASVFNASCFTNGEVIGSFLTNDSCLTSIPFNKKINFVLEFFYNY